MLVAFSRFIFVAIVLILAMATETVAAEGRRSPFMATTGPTSQPIGHYEFCERKPRECTMRSLENAPIALTSALWRQLISVNTRVNAAIAPMTDEDLFGKPEMWFYPTTAGDCEDYVLLKRRELMALGWPASVLLITVVRQPDGEGHAVLTVRTDRGDVILDNLQGEVLTWNETEYAYVKRQSDRDTGRWVGIADEGPLVVGTVRP